MLRFAAAAMAVLLVVPQGAAFAANKAPLTIGARVKGTGTLMRMFWKPSTVAANNYMRANSASTVSIPGTIFVGTTLQPEGVDTLHRWYFPGDFLQRTRIKGGLRLPMFDDRTSCPTPGGISQLGDLVMMRTSFEDFLSGIIVVGHVRAVCRNQRKQLSVMAADKLIADLYRESRNRVPSFQGGMCASAAACRT